MEWSGTAIVLSSARLGEHSGRVRILARDTGLRAGTAAGAFSRSGRGIYAQGNVISVRWRARTSEQLGFFSAAELIMPTAPLFMDDAARLHALTAACLLAEANMAEHHPEPRLYDALLHLLNALKSGTGWEIAYLFYELELLHACGVGLDLSACAVTGSADIRFVSPKTGRAVSEEGAGMYKHRLLPLPRFLLDETLLPTPEEIRQGLALTEFFLEKWVYVPREKPLPAARARMEAALAIA